VPKQRTRGQGQGTPWARVPPRSHGPAGGRVNHARSHQEQRRRDAGVQPAYSLAGAVCQSGSFSPLLPAGSQAARAAAGYSPTSPAMFSPSYSPGYASSPQCSPSWSPNVSPAYCTSPTHTPTSPMYTRPCTRRRRQRIARSPARSHPRRPRSPPSARRTRRPPEVSARPPLPTRRASLRTSPPSPPRGRRSRRSRRVGTRPQAHRTRPRTRTAHVEARPRARRTCTHVLREALPCLWRPGKTLVSKRLQRLRVGRGTLLPLTLSPRPRAALPCNT